ncbi:MAG TPA: hypothetical protein V6C72_16905 [Chroococcales cyanobacterium]
MSELAHELKELTTAGDRSNRCAQASLNALPGAEPRQTAVEPDKTVKVDDQIKNEITVENQNKLEIVGTGSITKASEAAMAVALEILRKDSEDSEKVTEQALVAEAATAAPATTETSGATDLAEIADFVEAIARREERRRRETSEDPELLEARRQVEDLMSWFRNYGKDGLILDRNRPAAAETVAAKLSA